MIGLPVPRLDWKPQASALGTIQAHSDNHGTCPREDA